MLEEQVAWYVEKSEALEAENGGKVYSLAFQHIIVQEAVDALFFKSLFPMGDATMNFDGSAVGSRSFT